MMAGHLGRQATASAPYRRRSRRQPRDQRRCREVARSLPLRDSSYRLRSLSTWTGAAFLFLIMAWGTAATADGADAVKGQRAAKAAQGIVLFGGLVGLLVSAALFGDAAIRDAAAEHGSAALHHCAFARPEYLGGRVVATLAINVIVVLAVPLGLLGRHG